MGSEAPHDPSKGDERRAQRWVRALICITWGLAAVVAALSFVPVTFFVEATHGESIKITTAAAGWPVAVLVLAAVLPSLWLIRDVRWNRIRWWTVNLTVCSLAALTFAVIAEASATNSPAQSSPSWVYGVIDLGIGTMLLIVWIGAPVARISFRIPKPPTPPPAARIHRERRR